MNKHDFVRNVSKLCGYSQAQTEEVIDAVFEAIADAVAHDEQVAIQNFGKFTSVVRAARESRNPLTGEPVHVPEKKAIKFSASKKLNESLNA